VGAQSYTRWIFGSPWSPAEFPWEPSLTHTWDLDPCGVRLRFPWKLSLTHAGILKFPGNQPGIQKPVGPCATLYPSTKKSRAEFFSGKTVFYPLETLPSP
jgi:hypothetical protein